MKHWILAGLLGVGALAAAVGAEEPDGPPKVGDVAPDFRLNDQDGRAVRRSEAAKDAWCVLAFFPKARTPG